MCVCGNKRMEPNHAATQIIIHLLFSLIPFPFPQHVILLLDDVISGLCAKMASVDLCHTWYFCSSSTLCPVPPPVRLLPLPGSTPVRPLPLLFTTVAFLSFFSSCCRWPFVLVRLGCLHLCGSVFLYNLLGDTTSCHVLHQFSVCLSLKT